MRTAHLTLFGLALLALLLGVMFALGGESSVQAADANARGAVGVGPASDLEAAAQRDAAMAASHTTRHAIATNEPTAAPVVTKGAHEKPAVRGRIVDDAGRGVPGARVWVTTSQFWALVPLDLEEDALPTRWLKVERTVCDADGRFEFAELESGKLRLAARAAGFAPSYREDLETVRDRDLELPDVALRRGVVVAGEVLGVDGKPAAGVRVLIGADSLARGGGLQVPGRGVPAGTTDASGKFRVDELASGPFHLLFLADGAELADLAGRTERAGEVQDGYVVRLVHGAEIAGRVVSAGGDLPAELRVVARRGVREEENEGEEEEAQDEPASADLEARPRSAPVDADGTFRIVGLRAGETYRLALGQKRGEAWKPAGSTQPTSQRAPTGGVVFTYKPESVVVLRVVDDATSQPIEDLVAWFGLGRLRVLQDDKNEVQRVFPLGAVRSTDLRPQPGSKPGWVRISAPGYQDFERKDLRLASGVELDLGEVRLKAEKRIVVTVVDVQGRPIEDARVIMTTQKAEALRNWSRMPMRHDVWFDTESRNGRTGEDGTCTLSSLPGKSVLVQASARGFVPSDVESRLLSKTEGCAITLKLAVGARVVVRVRDGAGRVVTGVPVGHKLPREASNSGEDPMGENVGTDARGEALFEALEVGVHAFRIQLEDGESAWWAEEEDSAAREEPWQEVTLSDSADVALTLIAPSRGTLSGTVREGGRPLEGAYVKLVPYVEGRKEGWAWSGSGNDPFASTTDHLGEYRIESRRAGEYLALVHHPERRMASEFRVVLGAGDQLQDFVLDANAIEGRVTDPDGRPLVGVRIGVHRMEAGMQMDPPQSIVLAEDDHGNPSVDWRDGAGAREARTDSQGQYVLRGLIENSALVVYCQGDEVENKSSEAIALAPGEIRRGVDFALRRAGRIRVELGGALADDRWYQVSVVAREGENEQVMHQSWLAKWNRSRTMGSIVPGTYLLRLSVRDNQGNLERLAEMSIDVEVGKLARATLQVP